MLSWHLKSFNELSLNQLYEIMRIRQQVFVVEQNCPFVDADNKDGPSYHLWGELNKQIVAYARIVPPGVLYPQPSIGRVVTHTAYRKQAYGRLLMQKAIEETVRLFGERPIKIMAQQYLEKFYTGYSFVKQGEPFLEDDIWHIMMVKE